MNTESCNNCEILELCTPEWRAYILKHSEEIFFKKGQLIFHEGMAVVGAYYIIEGKVKVFKTGFNNRKQVLNLNSSGNIIGHRGLNNKRFSISAEVMEDSKIAFLEKHHLDPVFKNNPALTYHMMLFYAEELGRSENLTRNHAQMNVRELSASALVQIIDKFGVTDSGFLNLDFSRQDLAEIAGTGKEQISKHLADFKQEGLIEPEGKKIAILNEEGIREIIQDYPEL